MKSLQKLLDQSALTKNEYKLIVKQLSREPNEVELGMFGALWSEHCGYKHSKLLLKLFPTSSSNIIVKAGEENAGVINIGDNLAIVMKIESHNHPSAVEPYHGAATGVGGIVRDIFAMGDIQIALLNSLRFGPLDISRNKYLYDGIVSGISDYGNCLGIPNVGGESIFHPTYSSNPLVNAMCVGILNHSQLIRSGPKTPNTLLVLVGAKTGRDGIHGASGLASRSLDSQSDLRASVQVANPFLEKVLIEACLEVAATGILDAMQDLGAAGLTSAAIEAAANGQLGIEIHLDQVPLREEGMTPYEIMLSESQERMLLMLQSKDLEIATSIFEKWDLDISVIGKFTDEQIANIRYKDQMVACLPIKALVTPPLYQFSPRKPKELTKLQNYDLSQLPVPVENPNEILLKMLALPNLANKQAIYQQYDHQVQDNTIVLPGEAGAAVLRIKGTSKGIALSTDGNGKLTYLDPYQGGMIAVFEACRNVVCTGAKPIAITNCLNFGNPENNAIYYQLKESIKGMATAAKALNIPVISGNVSLYNESSNSPIYPTPIVGALGILEDIQSHVTSAFKSVGDSIILLQAPSTRVGINSLGGSEFLEFYHGLTVGKPTINPAQEVILQNCILELIKLGIVKSATDCSEGGMITALAEACMLGSLGLTCDYGDFKHLTSDERWDALFFGEDQSRIIISTPSTQIQKVFNHTEKHQINCITLGTVTADTFRITPFFDIPIDIMSKTWNDALQIS